MTPSSTAPFTAAKSAKGAEGASNTSLPANSALTHGLSRRLVVAPFMANASVKQSPVKPHSFRSKSVTTEREKEEGVRLLSNAFT